MENKTNYWEGHFMWTRKEMKQRARRALNGTYWWCVLLCLIFNVISGLISNIWIRLQQLGQLIAHIPVSLTDIQSGIIAKGLTAYMQALYSAIGETIPEEFASSFQMFEGVESAFPYIPALLLIAVITYFIVYTFAVAPLQVGVQRFFLNAVERRQKISDIGYAFTSGYWNIIKVMLVYLLTLTVGFCLFIVPGIILTYRFYFVPYLLAENPRMKLADVFHTSAQMTAGNKWKIFVLQLSFYGWALLSIFCLCGVGVLFLTPYMLATYMQLYLQLRPNTQTNTINSEM